MCLAAAERLRELVATAFGGESLELEIVESVSHETVRRTLKKTA